MSKYVNYNANPFGVKNSKDCAIRAISKATDISYEEICHKLNKRFKDGFGMVSDGVDIVEVDKFARKTGILKPIKYDIAFLKDYLVDRNEYKPKYQWPTIKEFTDNFSNEGKYVLWVRSNEIKDMNSDGAREAYQMLFHAICVDCSKKEYYDILKYDPKDMIVYGILISTVTTKDHHQNQRENHTH